MPWTQWQRDVVIVPHRCDSLKAPSNPVKFGRFPFPRLPPSILCARLTAYGNGARSTERAEPTAEAAPARAHQFRYRPDLGGRNRAGKWPHGWSTERIRREHRGRGRLLQFGEPHSSQRAVVHRAVNLPLRYHAVGGRFRLVRREQESRQPRRNPGPRSQTYDGTWTSEPGAERSSRVRGPVLPVDREQVRQGQDIRWVCTDR